MSAFCHLSYVQTKEIVIINTFLHTGFKWGQKSRKSNELLIKVYTQNSLYKKQLKQKPYEQTVQLVDYYETHISFLNDRDKTLRTKPRECK